MKITVIHKDTTIIVDESDNEKSTDGKATMRWENQNKAIQDTITVIVDQCKKLRESSKDDY